MANQSVLELAVGTGKWDAGLKKAKDALNNFTQAQGGLQSALAKDSDKMQQFVRMMGQTDSAAKTAKGQLNDYKGTIETLTMQYNRMTEAQQKTIGQDYLQAIDQMKQKYQAVNKELQEMNQSLNATKSIDLGAATGGGGLFGGDKLSGMLQVFGGNVMTKVAGVGIGLVGELKDAVSQGIELAKQGEGIRIAFERLGRGDILDGLREATHGTVTDLELMKAAVKFNDFKLPLDELGTMLAFAQQKAKDTGQSVDYMVDSIVTGLGRKSLMILDNLGLSAAEIRERMKETGDMTKAVGAIIRDQMAKAGDYVETAADRALQANVSLQNKMEELGRKFGPVEEASNQLWTSIKIGILDIVGGPLARLLNDLTEAGRLQNELNKVNGGGNGQETQAEKALKLLRTYTGGSKGEEGKRDLYNRQIARWNQQEEGAWRKANKLREQLKGYQNAVKEDPTRSSDLLPFINDLTRRVERAENRAKAIQMVRAQYEKGAQEIFNPTPASSNTPVPVEIKNTPSSSTFDASKIIFTGGDGVKADPNQYFHSVWGMLGDQGLRAMMGIGAQQFDYGGKVLDNYVNDPDADKRKKKGEESTEKLAKAMSGLSSIMSGIEGVGVEIPGEIKDVINVIQSAMAIIQGVQTVISVFSTSTETANTAAVIANTIALGALTTAMAANTATNLVPGFANGGIIPHAAGGTVAGTHYSGDVTPILANAGEVVLNRAQVGNISSQLQGNNQQPSGSPYVTGEIIYLGLTNYLKSTGRGEMMTSRFKG